VRILPVTKEWEKLNNPSWPTFRLTRRDKDYYEGEVVQVVLHPRSKNRKVLGIARIEKKEKRRFPFLISGAQKITEEEAREDGFEGIYEMMTWFFKVHGLRARRETLNKLTLEWIGEHRV
jgi:hypothetical protein